MKNYMKIAGLAIALTAGATLAPRTVSAQSLVVDTEKVFTATDAGKSGANQMKGKYGEAEQKLRTAYTTALNQWNTQVEAANKIAKPDTPLPPATEKALQTARANLNDATTVIQELQQEEQSIGQYIRAQIFQVMAPIVEKIRADRRAQLVVPAGSVLAYDPATDITDLVIKSLNEKLPTVSIVPPKQAAPASTTAPATTTPATKQQPQSR